MQRRDFLRLVPAAILAAPALTTVAKVGAQSTGPTGLWTFSAGDWMVGGPAVANGVVYVGSADTNVYAIDAGSGEELWRFTTDGEVHARPWVSSNGLVYVGNETGTLYAIDVESQTSVMEYSAGDSIRSTPWVVDGIAYFGTYDFSLLAVDTATQQEVWKFETGGEVLTSPQVIEGVVYATSRDGNAYAVDAATGKELWRFKVDVDETWVAPSSPVVDGGIVSVGGNGYAFGLNATTGAKEWEITTDDAVLADPAVAYATAYFATNSGSLYAVDTWTGDPLWNVTGGWGNDQPIVYNGVLYINSYDADTGMVLLALDPKTGEERWRHPYEGGYFTRMAIADDVLYGSGESKVLTALTLG